MSGARDITLGACTLIVACGIVGLYEQGNSPPAVNWTGPVPVPVSALSPAPTPAPTTPTPTPTPTPAITQQAMTQAMAHDRASLLRRQAS
jgi:hypothetical protein